MLEFFQNQDLVYLIYAGIALGVFLVFTGISQVLSRGESGNEARSRRMRMIAKGATTAEILALLKPEPDTGPLSRLPLLGDLPKLMRSAGLTMAPTTLMFLCLVAGVAGFVASTPLLGVVGGAVVALIAGVAVPFIILSSLRTKRADAMIRQLPDTLDLLARGLKVGHPLNATINSVAREMSDPIGTEFGLISDQVSYGDDLVDAFAEFADRADLEDVYYLSTSIAIQNGTGGDLGRVLELLAKVIRGRISMRQKIKAISSEGRLSAVILSLVPLLMYGFISFSAPSYYSAVADDPLFRPMAIAVVGLIVLNYVILKRLVAFRI